ncbi:hypothetical protein AB0G48_24845 [Streptomyces rubiginosohelvolus]
MITTPMQVEAGKHDGQPSDKPWTPPQEPKPSPDGSRLQVVQQS